MFLKVGKNDCFISIAMSGVISPIWYSKLELLDLQAGRESSGGVTGISMAVGQHPKGRAFSGAHLPLSPSAEAGHVACGGSGKVQARPRAGSGGADWGHIDTLSSRILQAGDGEAELKSPT